MPNRERIVTYEQGADLDRDVVLREPEPPRQLPPVFRGTGPERGEYESSLESFTVEYLPPRRRAA